MKRVDFGVYKLLIVDVVKLDDFHHVLWLAVDVFNQKMCSDDLPGRLIVPS